MSELDEYIDETNAGTEADQSDLSHDLASEAIERIEKPLGSPTFVPVAALTRLYETRAEFFRELRSVDLATISRYSSGELDLTDMSVSFTLMDAFMSSVAAAMRAMRVVCPDKGAFDRWVKAAGDEDRLTLLFWYMQEMQPGEAPASPSS